MNGASRIVPSTGPNVENSRGQGGSGETSSCSARPTEENRKPRDGGLPPPWDLIVRFPEIAPEVLHLNQLGSFKQWAMWSCSSPLLDNLTGRESLLPCSADLRRLPSRPGRGPAPPGRTRESNGSDVAAEFGPQSAHLLPTARSAKYAKRAICRPCPSRVTISLCHRWGMATKQWKQRTALRSLNPAWNLVLRLQLGELHLKVRLNDAGGDTLWQQSSSFGSGKEVTGRCLALDAWLPEAPGAPGWSGSVWPPTRVVHWAATGSRPQTFDHTPCRGGKRSQAPSSPWRSSTNAGALAASRLAAAVAFRPCPQWGLLRTGFHSTLEPAWLSPYAVPESWRGRACAAFFGSMAPHHQHMQARW